MPGKRLEKTIKQRHLAFARHYVNHGDAEQAYIDAGYSPGTAREHGSTLLFQPEIASLILRELNKVRAQSGVIGYRAARSIAQNESHPAGARMTAARTLLEVAGMIGKAQEQGGSKEVGEMSTGELRDLVDRLDKELGDRSRPIVTIDQAPAPQLAEMID